MKRCAKCGRELPESEFHKSRRSKDGLASYCHTDAFNPEKALEMFSVVQDYHNPDHDIDAAIRLHNKAPWYGKKVLRRIQTIKQYEEYRKIVNK